MNDCSTSCKFNTPENTIASLLVLSTTYYTFNYSIPQSLIYSFIGIDLTFYASTSPSISLTLSGASTFSTPATTGESETSIGFESDFVSCSSQTAIPLYIARATSTSTSQFGSLKVQKSSSNQSLGIRSIRLWVNCSPNCLTCATSTFCSACIADFARHTTTINSQTYAACEVISACPIGCAQCYTLATQTYCTKCLAGFTETANNNNNTSNPSCTCTANNGSACQSTEYQYINDQGSCANYSTTGFYINNNSWTAISTSFNPSKYACKTTELILLYDYYAYGLYRCGCTISNCAACTNTTTCTTCKVDFYLDIYGSTCIPASVANCAVYDVLSFTCVTCLTGFYLDMYCSTCIPGSVANCAVYDVLSNSCVTCKADFYLDMYCSTCIPSSVVSCAVYDQITQKCVTCKDNFYLDIYRTSCIPSSVVNCAIYDNIASSCVTCVHGFHFSESLICIGDIIATALVYLAVESQRVTQSGVQIVLASNGSEQLLTYAAQNLQDVLVVRLVSGKQEFSVNVLSVSGKQIVFEIQPSEGISLKRETAMLTLSDSMFNSINSFASISYSVQVLDFIYLSEAEKTANESINYAAYVTTGVLLVAMVPILIITNFYFVINTIDLTGFLYYSLFIDVRYPSNVIAFYEFFQDFQFPMIPNAFQGIVGEGYVQTIGGDNADSNSSIDVFTRNNTSLYFLSSTGQTVTIAVGVTIVYVLLKIVSVVRIPRVSEYFQRAVYRAWEYSAFFELLWTIYIYLAFGVLLQFKCFDFGDGSAKFNYSLHGIAAVVVFGSPLAICLLLFRKENLKSDLEFQRKFQALIGGILLFDSVEGTLEQPGSCGVEKVSKSVLIEEDEEIEGEQEEVKTRRKRNLNQECQKKQENDGIILHDQFDEFTSSPRDGVVGSIASPFSRIGMHSGRRGRGAGAASTTSDRMILEFPAETNDIEGLGWGSSVKQAYAEQVCVKIEEKKQQQQKNKVMMVSQQPLRTRFRDRCKVSLSRMYMGMLYVRKLLFVVVIVFGTAYPYVQLSLVSGLNAIVCAFTVYVEPLEDVWENRKNAVGEVVLLFIAVCTWFLVEDHAEELESNRLRVGWIIIGLSGFIIAWHTVQLVVMLFKLILTAVKRVFCCYDNTKTTTIMNGKEKKSSRVLADEEEKVKQELKIKKRRKEKESEESQSPREKQIEQLQFQLEELQKKQKRMEEKMQVVLSGKQLQQFQEESAQQQPPKIMSLDDFGMWSSSSSSQKQLFAFHNSPVSSVREGSGSNSPLDYSAQNSVSAIITKKKKQFKQSTSSVNTASMSWDENEKDQSMASSSNSSMMKSQAMSQQSQSPLKSSNNRRKRQSFFANGGSRRKIQLSEFSNLKPIMPTTTIINLEERDLNE